MFSAYASADLGQRNDYTAIVVAEEALWIPTPPVPTVASGPQVDRLLYWQNAGRGWVPPSTLSADQRTFFRDLNYGAGQRPDRPPLLVRHIERVRERSYVDVVNEVAALLARPPLSGLDVALLADAGGVGVAVLDLMRQHGLRPWSITATGGDNVNVPEYGVIRVPKRELISAAQIALAQGRLRIAAGLAHAPTLVKELQAYQVKISQSGHDSYAAREGAHDDLVYAVAQMCWFRDWNSYHCDVGISA